MKNIRRERELLAIYLYTTHIKHPPIQRGQMKAKLCRQSLSNTIPMRQINPYYDRLERGESNDNFQRLCSKNQYPPI